MLNIVVYEAMLARAALTTCAEAR